MRNLVILFCTVLVLTWCGVAYSAEHPTPAVTIIDTTSSRVIISWEPISINEEVYGSLTFFEVWRCVPENPNWFHCLASVSKDVYTYSDTSVVEGYSYMYAVAPAYSTGVTPQWSYTRSPLVTIPITNDSGSTTLAAGVQSLEPLPAITIPRLNVDGRDLALGLWILCNLILL